VLVLTPVCAHALYVRFDCGASFFALLNQAIAQKGTEVEAVVMVDGQLTFRLSEGDVAHVRFSERTANLVRLSEFRFIERLKRKLKWGHRDETVTEH
jgi:NAD kinase